MEQEDKYTIIIPTMYFYSKELQRMIDIYEQIDAVYEILIVNNNNVLKVNLNGLKVRTIGIGVNLYVNPSWRFAATLAKTNNLVFVNDDIYVKGDLNELFAAVTKLGLRNKVIGASRHAFKEKELWEGSFVLEESNKRTLPHGFGVFMFMDRKTYLDSHFPKGLKVWYGDMVLYKMFRPYDFKGLEIVTEFAGTSKKIDLTGFAAKEKFIYGEFLKEFKTWDSRYK